MWHSRRKSTFRWQKRKMSFLYQKIALTSFYPMVLVALQYPFVSLSYKRSRPRSYTAEERRNQAKKSRAMFPFTSVKRSRWSYHTHIIFEFFHGKFKCTWKFLKISMYYSPCFFSKKWLRNHPKFLLHFQIHIDVLMLCRKFVPIPSSNFRVMAIFKNQPISENFHVL